MLFAGAQDADGGNLSGHLDFAAGPRHLWTRLDPGAVRTGYRRQGGGDQLLCRHAAVCRSHSRAGKRDATFRLKCRRATPPGGILRTAERRREVQLAAMRPTSFRALVAKEASHLAAPRTFTSSSS